MRHTREEVIQRTEREFEQLEQLAAGLSDADWQRPVPRPETKDAWTVKDSLVHILHWQADMARRVRGERVPAEERGLNIDDGNRLVYLRWRDRPPQEVLAWLQQVKQAVLAALRAASEEYFGGKERNPQWPYDIEGHSAYHRARDIEAAVGKR